MESGHFVCEYVGIVYDVEDVVPEQRENGYLFDTGGGIFFDAEQYGSKARFINHMCEPNCRVEVWTMSSGERRVGIFSGVLPRVGLRTAFEDISTVIHMSNEAGHRVFLSLFLSDIVFKFDGVLRIFPELDIAVENKAKKRRLNGKTDYTVGFGKDVRIFATDPPRELHIVALEATTEFSEKDFWQCVAETASLHKSRVDANKTMKSVWGILSNA